MPTDMDLYIPFNSVDGDRRHKAEGLADMLASVMTNGVHPNPGNSLFVSAAGGWNVAVNAGRCVINGRLGMNATAKTLTVDPPNGVQPRVDTVVLRCDPLSDRKITQYIGKGTPSANPVPNPLQRNEDAYELCIAQIYVARDAQAIVQSAITDTRQNAQLCGVINSLIKVDPDTLFAQYSAAWTEFFTDAQSETDGWMTAAQQQLQDWTNAEHQAMQDWMSGEQAAFDTWFAALQTDLNGDVAASLAARIETVAGDLTAFELGQTGKNSAYDAHVGNRSNPHAVTAAQTGAVALVGEKASADATSAAIVPITGSRTLVLADAGTLIRIDSASASTVTVPTDATVPFPAGTEVEIARFGTGSVTIAGASGVTIRSIDGVRTISAQYVGASLKKVAANEWWLAGGLG